MNNGGIATSWRCFDWGLRPQTPAFAVLYLFFYLRMGS
jgi:hypothetical protein